MGTDLRLTIHHADAYTTKLWLLPIAKKIFDIGNE